MAAKKKTTPTTKPKAAKVTPLKVVDRPLMDMGGTKPKPQEKGFMHEQADLDRTDAKSAKLDKALGKVKEDANAISKAIAHGQTTEGDEMKVSVLAEIATLGNRIRDASRKAIRDAKESPTTKEAKKK